MLKFKSKKSAFTLIELLVVIAIIGVLATFSIISLSNARAKSRDAKRTADIKQVQTALELFFNDNNRYPTFDEWNTGQIYSTSTAGTSTYMQVIPTAPTPSDGSCTTNQNSISYVPAPNGSSYSLSFCIGNTTGTLASGPKCLTPGGIVDTDCSGNLLTMVVHGGAGIEYGYFSDMDDNYIYVPGLSASAPAAGNDATLIKFDKNTLSLLAYKMYGGGGTLSDSFSRALVDGDSVYVSGRTASEGFGLYDDLLYKFDKDLNLLARKTIGGIGGEGLSPILADDDYLYLGGSSDSSSSGLTDALLIKLNKSDLSIVYQKLYGGALADSVSAVVMDGDNFYVAVSTKSEGYGGYDIVLLQIDKNDFTILNKKIIGSTLDDSPSNDRIIQDSEYLYLSGTTKYEGVGGTADTLLLKIRKSDLTIVSQKMYGGAGTEGAPRIELHGNYLYLFGRSESEGQGVDGDSMILKFDKNDLSLLSKKLYGGIGSDAGNGLLFSNGYLYTAGSVSNNTAGVNDFSVLRFRADLPSGTYNTTPAGFVLTGSNLTFKDSHLLITDSNLTYQNASLSIQDSTLTEKTPSWTMNGPFVIQ